MQSVDHHTESQASVRRPTMHGGARRYRLPRVPATTGMIAETDLVDTSRRDRGTLHHLCGATAVVARRRGDAVRCAEQLRPAGADSRRGVQETLQALKGERIPSDA